MKQIIKCLRYSPFLLALCAMVFFGCRCSTTKPTPDPLAGWKFRAFDEFSVPADRHHYHLDKAITDNYQDFIKKNRLNTLGAITGFFEDGTGQHAIKFEASAPNQNNTWHYVLIYNKDNKRIKEIRYSLHRFRS